MADLSKDGIKVRKLLRTKPPLIEPADPIYEVKITVEMEAQKKKHDVRNQEKWVGWEKRLQKAREKGVLCNSFCWDEVDAKTAVTFFYASAQRCKDKSNQEKFQLAHRNQKRLYGGFWRYFCDNQSLSIWTVQFYL